MERRSDEATDTSRNLPPTSIPHFPFSRNEVQYGVFTPLQPDAIRIKNITPTDSQPPSREGGFFVLEERLNSASHQIALILVTPKTTQVHEAGRAARARTREPFSQDTQ